MFFLEHYESDSENPYFYLWVISSIVSSCYTYTWDIKMDWGLFEVYEGDNKFLREEIVYSSTVIKIYLNYYYPNFFQRFYYFAIVEDFILRFAWVTTYMNSKLKFVPYDILSTLLPPLEVFRYVIKLLSYGFN